MLSVIIYKSHTKKIIHGMVITKGPRIYNVLISLVLSATSLSLILWIIYFYILKDGYKNILKGKVELNIKNLVLYIVILILIITVIVFLSISFTQIDDINIT